MILNKLHDDQQDHGDNRDIEDAGDIAIDDVLNASVQQRNGCGFVNIDRQTIGVQPTPRVLIKEGIFNFVMTNPLSIPESPPTINVIGMIHKPISFVLYLLRSNSPTKTMQSPAAPSDENRSRLI